MVVLDPRIARALAAPARAEILGYLERSTEPRSVEEVAKVVGLHVNTVRSHLDVLVDVGLVSRDGERRRGPGRPRVLYAASTAGPSAAVLAGGSTVPQAGGAVPSGGADVVREAPVGASSVGASSVGAASAEVSSSGASSSGAAADGYRQLALALVEQLAAVARDPHGSGVEAGRRWLLELERAGWDPDRESTAEADVARVVELLDRLGFQPRTEPLGDRVYLHACPFRDVVGQNGILCSVHLGLLRGAFQRLGGRVEVTGCDARVRPDLCVVRLTPTGPGTATAAGATG